MVRLFVGAAALLAAILQTARGAETASGPNLSTTKILVMQYNTGLWEKKLTAQSKAGIANYCLEKY